MSKTLAVALVLVFLTASNIIVVLPVSGAVVTENKWTSKASMNQPRSGLGAAVVDDKIYAIGGLIMSGTNPNSVGVDYREKGWVVNTTEEYNPNTNRWIGRASMPTSRYNFAIASYQGKIFCFGGITNWVSGKITVTNVTEVYDPATDTWSTKASMPTAVVGQANVLGNKIYIISGELNQVYDPISDSWSIKASLPKTSLYQVSVTMGNKMYVVGYWQDLSNNIASINYVYDPNTDTWSSRQAVHFNFHEKGVVWRGDWNSEAIGATSGFNAPMGLYVLFMQYVYSGPLPNLNYNQSNNSWNAVQMNPPIDIILQL